MKQDIIDINTFDYHLPEERIAKYPLEKRDNSNLLISKPGKPLYHIPFSKIASELSDENIIVYNNTKVIHARMIFQKATGARIEIFLLTPHLPADYQQVFTETTNCTWTCLVGNLKKWKDEILCMQIDIKGQPTQINAEKVGSDSKNNQLIKFSWNNNFTFAEILNASGKVPVPPYLNRDSEEIDNIRYQTVYSKFDGSVAAPTAGLHFTGEVFENLKNKKITTVEITLHVGAGTFQPVKAENALEHKMHGEQIILKKEFLENILAHKGKIIATGTTTMRTLESLHWLGVKVLKGETPSHLNQWDWKNLDQEITYKESFNALLEFLMEHQLERLPVVTEIMIVPGYKFKVVDCLITNFHQPKSTLLLLIAAFVGERWKDIYSYAMTNNFRFLSYGDSSLLFR